MEVLTPDHARQFVNACRAERINGRPCWGSNAAALRRYAQEREGMALRQECLGRTASAEIEREIARIFKEGAAEIQALQDERNAAWEREQAERKIKAEAYIRACVDKHKGRI